MFCIGIFLVFIHFSCFPKGDSSSSPTANDTTGNTGTGADTSGTTIKQLTFFEEKLTGLWSRYHSYDGSTKYIKINSNRTACDWEEDSGSNYRESKSYFTYWEITKETSSNSNRFIVNIQGSGLSSGYTFDYANDVLYPTDYSNLKYYRDKSGKTCE